MANSPSGKLEMFLKRLDGLHNGRIVPYNANLERKLGKAGCVLMVKVGDKILPADESAQMAVAAMDPLMTSLWKMSTQDLHKLSEKHGWGFTGSWTKDAMISVAYGRIKSEQELAAKGKLASVPTIPVENSQADTILNNQGDEDAPAPDIDSILAKAAEIEAVGKAKVEEAANNVARLKAEAEAAEAARIAAGGRRKRGRPAKKGGTPGKRMKAAMAEAAAAAPAESDTTALEQGE